MLRNKIIIIIKYNKEKQNRKKYFLNVKFTN